MAISNPSLAQIKKALTEMLPKLKPLSVPTGMISAFHTVPEGWLQCNGAAVSRTTYAALFAVIGTKYGSGDGSTTFNLPNLHHRFIEGTNTTSEVGQSVSAGLPNITGYLCKSDFSNDTSYTGVFSQTERGSAWGGGTSGYENTWDRPYFSARASNSAYGSSSVVQPASIRMTLCLKL